MDEKNERERKKDDEQQTSVDFEAREKHFLKEVGRIWGEERLQSEDFTGLMKNYEKYQNVEAKIHDQTRHNASHALYSLAMIAGGVISLKGHRADYFPRVLRIHCHLMFLKEFIRPEQVKLGLKVDRLCEALLTENPSTKAGWLHFMYHHWFLIRSFADEYGWGEKCCSETTYEKLREMFLGKASWDDDLREKQPTG